jgi:ribonuclease BN (tRNA processing enzyme)
VTATLTVLGAGSILPRAGYGCAGYALRAAPGGPVTLLDCGPGSVRSLAGNGVELREVTRVVLSHFHLDHCLDLYALAFARRSPFVDGLPPLELVGPVGLRERFAGGHELLGGFARDPDTTCTEVALDGERRGGFERGGEVWSCVATGHPQQAVAWRVDLSTGESLAYTGDTGPNPAVSELARGVDLLVSECSFPDEEEVAQHLTPTSAARLATDAGARRLLLSHFYPSMDPPAARARAAETFRGPIELARDGAVLAVGAGAAG